MARWRTHHNRKRRAQRRAAPRITLIEFMEATAPFPQDWQRRMIQELSRPLGLSRSMLISHPRQIATVLPDGETIGGEPGGRMVAADAYRNPLYDQIRRERVRR